MLSKTQKLTYTAMLLAIAMISMIVKGGGSLVVIFVTGAVVNACIIIASHLCGLSYGIALSILTPIAAYFISPNPVHQTLPIVVICIMAGNAILALCVSLISQKGNAKIMLPASMAAGSILKAVFMGVTISLIILPNLIPVKLPDKVPAIPLLQYTFSVVQLFAALVGSVYAFTVLKVKDRFLK